MAVIALARLAALSPRLQGGAARLRCGGTQADNPRTVSGQIVNLGLCACTDFSSQCT